jgi:hypothetical protein
MAITVARGVGTRISQNRRGIVIQVQRPSDPEAATAALTRARAEIANLDGGWQSAPGLSPGDRNGPTYVGAVVATPAGPFLYLDGGETPDELLARIPDIVTNHLRDAGVTRAVVAFPLHTDTPLFKRGPVLNYLPRAAVLHLYPLPAPIGTIPPITTEWLDEAAAWVAQDFDGETGAWAQALSVVFPIERRATREVFDQCRRAGAVQVVAGDLEHRIRALHVEFRGEAPAVAVAGGGPSATDEELVATIDDLTRIARRLVPTLGYAHVSVWPTFLGMHTGTWRDLPGGGNGYLGGLHDEIALDAMPWQLLGPGHLRRLEAAGTLPLDDLVATARPLADGMVEVGIGQPSDWLLDSPSHDQILLAGRRLLAPCLPPMDEWRDRYEARWADRRAAGS